MGASRRALLTVALGFCAIDWRGPTPVAAAALHGYMDSWRGVGLVVDAMRRHGFKLVHLTTIDDELWRASFATNAYFAAEGFGGGTTPWVAMQRAAWTALKDPSTTPA